MKNVTIIDYGLGNVWSVISAFQYLGCNVNLLNDPDKLSVAQYIILPGVGSFRKGMESLRSKGFDKAIHEAVNSGGAKILGICLGMQLLGTHGTEDGENTGLGLVGNRIEQFTQKEIGLNKLPHVGFNPIKYKMNNGFFKDLSNPAEFYFTHSYRMVQEDLNGDIALCNYGSEFLAAFKIKNIYGTQFHPEKSQTNGLILLRNFLDN